MELLDYLFSWYSLDRGELKPELASFIGNTAEMVNRNLDEKYHSILGDTHSERNSNIQDLICRVNILLLSKSRIVSNL